MMLSSENSAVLVDERTTVEVTNLKRGQSGHVLQHTATDVLVMLGRHEKG